MLHEMKLKFIELHSQLIELYTVTGEDKYKTAALNIKQIINSLE